MINNEIQAVGVKTVAAVATEKGKGEELQKEVPQLINETISTEQENNNAQINSNINMEEKRTDGQSVTTETMPTEQASVQLPTAEGEVDQQTEAHQNQSGVVGSEVENVNLPIQMIEEKVLSGKTKDAIKFIQELAENGNSNAAYYLGKLYMEGDVVKKNEHKGVMYLQKAADLGNIKAKMEIAVSILRCGNDEEAAEMAFGMFHDIAMKGNAEAEMVLSCFYFKGYGCEKNKTLADMWHLKARIDDFNEKKVFEILGMDKFINNNDYE